MVFAKTLSFVAKSVGTYLSFLIPVTALLRVIDSAKAQAKLADLKKYAEELPEITKKTTDVARAFASIQFPISALINKLGESISFLFQKTWWIGQIYNILKRFDIENIVRTFSGSMIYLYTAIEQTFVTLFKKIFDLFKNPAKLLSPLGMIDDFMTNYMKNLDSKVKPRWDAMNKHFDKYMKDAEKPPAPVYNNYAPITIRNQFPENMEPDRIAVSIKEAFMKSEQARIDSDRRQQTFTPATAYAR